VPNRFAAQDVVETLRESAPPRAGPYAEASSGTSNLDLWHADDRR
jgi:hypothetical protein